MWISIAMMCMTLTNVMSKQNENTISNSLNVKNIKNNKTVILKCCDLHSYHHYLNNTCVNTDIKFDPPIYKEENNNETIEGANVYEVFEVKFLIVDCGVNDAVTLSNLKLFKNGSIQGENFLGKYENHSPGHYCIDNILEDDTQSEIELSAVVCAPPEHKIDHPKLNSTCMLVSCFFIVLTIAVYACLPMNLHAMVSIAYLSSFLVGFLLLAIMNIIGLYTKQCVVFTFVIYFSWLSAFFWLNVMSFDIWYTFSGKRSLSGPNSMRSHFIAYSMYAFGVPAILTIVLAILEFTLEQENSIYLPRLDVQTCFISGQSRALYFYGPIVILCVANLTFFVLTALEIALTKRTIERGLQKTDKKRFILYIKLFIMMGVNWILEVVSHFFPDAVCIWRFTDAYNLLVGLIMFLVFVCKKKTFILLVNRFRVWRGLPPLCRTQTTNTSLSTRTLSQSREEIGMLSTISNK